MSVLLYEKLSFAELFEILSGFRPKSTEEVLATKPQRHEDLKSEEVKIFGHEKAQKAQKKVVSCEL